MSKSNSGVTLAAACAAFLATAALILWFPSASAAEDRATAPGERPTKPFQEVPVQRLRLLGLVLVPGGKGLEGRTLNDLLTEKAVSRIVVLENNTQMMDEGHLGRIARAVSDNLKIEPAWETGPHWIDRSRVFFTALLVTDKGEYVGFQLTRENMRVVTKDGDGLVSDRPTGGAE